MPLQRLTSADFELRRVSLITVKHRAKWWDGKSWHSAPCKVSIKPVWAAINQALRRNTLLLLPTRDARSRQSIERRFLGSFTPKPLSLRQSECYLCDRLPAFGSVVPLVAMTKYCLASIMLGNLEGPFSPHMGDLPFHKSLLVFASKRDPSSHSLTAG